MTSTQVSLWCLTITSLVILVCGAIISVISLAKGAGLQSAATAYAFAGVIGAFSANILRSLDRRVSELEKRRSAEGATPDSSK